MGGRMTRTGPREYTQGLGEVVRGYRLYTGLSQEAMADKLEMSLRSYQRIESGAAACPPDLFLTLEHVVNEFDTAVGDVVNAAKALGRDTVVVYPDLEREWLRCVANRAAVEYDRLTPQLVRTHRRQNHVARQ